MAPTGDFHLQIFPLTLIVVNRQECPWARIPGMGVAGKRSRAERMWDEYQRWRDKDRGISFVRRRRLVPEMDRKLQVHPMKIIIIM